MVVGVVEVFKVFSLYRIQQRRRSRLLTFQFAVEDIFKVFAKDSFQERHCLALQMRPWKFFFFNSFPQDKKEVRSLAGR